MQFTEHFSLEELTASEMADRINHLASLGLEFKGKPAEAIDNTPPVDVVPRLNVVAHGLEDVRALLGHPMHIDSGYRCPALNAAVGGAKASAHMDGYAADFICPEFGTPLKIVQAISASGIAFDKCIQEGTWVHISFAPELRRELLTAHFGPAGTTYTQGVTNA